MTLHEEMSMAAHARIAESLRPGSTPVAPARPTPQERTPLSVVPAPLPRSRSGVTVLCVLVVLAALAAVLVMNITMSNRQYALLDLRQEQQAVTETNERLAEQVAEFYPDLKDERFESAFAIYHQRYCYHRRALELSCERPLACPWHRRLVRQHGNQFYRACSLTSFQLCYTSHSLTTSTTRTTRLRAR